MKVFSIFCVSQNFLYEQKYILNAGSNFEMTSSFINVTFVFKDILTKDISGYISHIINTAAKA